MFVLLVKMGNGTLCRCAPEIGPVKLAVFAKTAIG
jgi:hypothetical protein